MQRLALCALLLLTSTAALALKNAAPADVNIEGRWVVNDSQSDDAEAWLAQRRAEDMKRMRRFEEEHKRRMENDPFAWEPEYTPPERTPQNRMAMEERERNVRRLMGATRFLTIKQNDNGAKLELVSEFETRRYDAGAETQVSLPQGQLADSTSGWDGEWFVIDRSARKGPRITEKYRLLKKTDQLEAQITIKGDSALSGMKLRRVFDRGKVDTTPIDPGAGPVR